MSRAAEHQAQHADPTELVHERGRARQAGREREPAGPRVFAQAYGDGERLRTGFRLRAKLCPDHHGEQHVEQSRNADGARQADCVNQQETADEHADGRTQAVGEVQGRQSFPGPIRPAADDATADEGERHAEQYRLRQDERGSQGPFVGLNPGGRGKRGYRRGKGEIRGGDEDGMKAEAQHADQTLDHAHRSAKSPDAHGVMRNDPRSNRHAPHENGEHERLCVRGVAQEELQVVRPDRFVDQPREARYDEYGEQKSAAGTLSAGTVGPRARAAIGRAGHVAS